MFDGAVRVMTMAAGEKATLPVGVQVRVTGGPEKGKDARVAAVTKAGEYELMMFDRATPVTVRAAEVAPAKPAKKDKLIVFEGELAGQMGTLIGIDGEDGIVKMMETNDIKILHLKVCAKWAEAA